MKHGVMPSARHEQKLDDERTARFRWPRFRLSTVLVLVAIFAWEMSYWPFAKAAPVGYGMVLAINARAIWPVLALLAFLTWKLASPLVARWRTARRDAAG